MENSTHAVRDLLRGKHYARVAGLGMNVVAAGFKVFQLATGNFLC